MYSFQPWICSDNDVMMVLLDDHADDADVVSSEGDQRAARFVLITEDESGHW